MSIQGFASSGVYDHRNIILPVTLVAVPLAVEAINFGVELYRDPGRIARKCRELKASVYNAFHQQNYETKQAFRRRLAKNIILTTLVLMALAGAACCPFFVLPTAFAIPAALGAIHIVGKAMVYLYKTPDCLKKCKNYLHDAFHQRPSETIEAFRKRRLQAIVRIAGYTILFAAAVAAAFYASHLVILMSKAKDVWHITDCLPYQTAGVVIAEYVTVGLLHAYQAYKHGKKGNWSRSIFHMVSACVSVMFPLMYLFSHHEMRLHHSFIGLALQLAPWRAVRCLGCAITLDSALYFVADPRGYVGETSFETEVWNRNKRRWETKIEIRSDFYRYDFMNTLIDNLPFVLTAMTGLSLLQTGLDYLLGKRKKKPKQNLEPLKKVRRRRTGGMLYQNVPDDLIIDPPVIAPQPVVYNVPRFRQRNNIQYQTA